jgi:two-component system, NtrC family, response regulator AtoC
VKYFTLIGNHDFISKDSGPGAAMTIFNEYKEKIDGVYIFASPGPYKEMSEKIARRMKSFSNNKDLQITIVDLDIESPVDFDLVYKAMLDESRTVIEEDKLNEQEIIINITSGTPTMCTCWVLLAQSSLIPNARLIQSFEATFQRKYGKACQEVDFNIDDFPDIKSPDKVKRELNRVSKENKILKSEKKVIETDSQMPDLIGNSKSMRAIKDQIMRMINTETHVLILGERGTGKEIIAKSIWNAHRKEIDKKLVAYDCGGITPTLIESELFGHIKGSFTGADNDKVGLIETNNEKMVFLDEIGNIPRANQNVFMRLLQSGEIRRVGSNDVKKLNVQIIAATNKDINDEEIFASDLKDRFQETITIPPLRERKEDIPILAEFFLKRSDKNVSFAKSVYVELIKYPWAGNVRELQNWVGRMCRYFNNEQVEWDDIPENYRPDSPSLSDEEIYYPDFPFDYNNYVDQLRLRAIEVSKGNSSAADRLLGLKDGTTKQWRHQRKNRSE